jgi:hypothetical protein
MMKKGCVLNKLNFQSETNLSSDINFNHFFSKCKQRKPKQLQRDFIVLVPLIILKRKTDYYCLEM